MTVLKALRDIVAPELNHLYTVPPFQTPGGMDLGWFCREHAVHTYTVARLFGAEADIRTGDFAILSPHVPGATSIGSGADHSWCSIAGVRPVDLSMTFRLFGEGPQLRSAIVGEGMNGNWTIRYAVHESSIDSHRESESEVYLIERKIEPHSEEDLLRDPHCFLFPPRDGDQGSWRVIYGDDIYAKISLHCYSVATRVTKSLCRRLDSAEAVRWISEHYPDATRIIRGKVNDGA